MTSTLEVPLTKWSSMSQNQRKKHLERIKNLTLQEAKQQHKKKAATSESSLSTDKSLTLCGKQFSVDGCQLSGDILKNMFVKAEKLVCGQNKICPAPGSVNAKLVESKSGQRPHFVVRKSSSKYNCDSDCPMWKCLKLCSHTIACVYQDGCLQEFLAHATSVPSLYALSKVSTTTKAGKKPQKRKASCKASTKVFAELREQMNPPQCEAPHSEGLSVSCVSSAPHLDHSSSVSQCPISLSQSCKPLHFCTSTCGTQSFSYMYICTGHSCTGQWEITSSGHFSVCGSISNCLHYTDAFPLCVSEQIKNLCLVSTCHDSEPNFSRF